MIGKAIAHYQIEALLGAGGMGEVYQARDTRLGRSVAVKMLPEIFAHDPDRVARFEREAKLLASLNHANIAALHGLEEFEGRHFLVMELVEGETLAERIQRGSIPVDEALKIAHQISEALEAAHDKGVVHRDLKPANVKITPEGKVKVLDFGLAKAMETAPANMNLSNSPTLSMMATNAGVILGTAAYMSPEQARGENTDRRSDIFSFGCLLYEMLTGRQSFQGKTVSDVLASVLAREPDLNLLPPRLNPRIPQLIRRAIEKDPKRRWQSIGDVRVEIETILADGSLVETPPQAASSKPLWKRAIPVLVTSVLLSAITGFVVWSLRSATPTNVTRFSFTLPEGQQFTNPGRQLVAISPDGTKMVYVANRQLHLRLMNELVSRPIPGTEDTAILNPVFSPDGNSIAFIVDNTLKRIPVTGGTPVTICPIENNMGVSWGTNDEIVFGQGGVNRNIMRVSAKGGKPETLVSVKNDEFVFGPELLPGGKAILFTLAKSGAADRWDKAQIVVQTLGSNDRKVLIEGGSDGRFIPTGHIVYALAGTLFAVPFDLRKLEKIGGPVPIVEGVSRPGAAQTGVAHFAVSDTGSLIYVPGAANASSGFQSAIALVDRNGGVKRIPLPDGAYSFPRIAPDGKRLAYETNDGKENNIWVYDLSGQKAPLKLTFGGTNRFPIWSGDGERVVFMSNRDGDGGMFWQRGDGSGTAERLTKPENGVEHHPDSWVPKGQFFAYTVGGTGRNSVWVFSFPDKKASLFVDLPSSLQQRSAFSPDGRWLAYNSDETRTIGNFEVYVQPYPPTGSKYQVSKGGGNHPLWSPDGKELFYRVGTRLVSTTVTTQPSFSLGNPVQMPIEGWIQFGQGSARNYDITPDGKQFIMVYPAAQTQSPDRRAALQIQVVLNWFEELKQSAPVK
jgi:eukaryotic-like serine/threonine-protein kinase